MTTFAVTNSDQLLPAVNYLLSNLDTTGTGNVVLPGNVLVANTSTGVISQEGNATPFGYLYQYVNLRYSNNATGTAGFDTNSNNYSYFGVYNSATSAASANPSAYQWYEVSPPFDTATSRTLYYSAIGGRQIQWAAASSPPSTAYQVTVANVAIDLDVVTTAAGTPGDRGPIALAFVITTADPNGASDIQLTGWFSASRDNTSPPIGTGLTPVVGDTATFTYVDGPGQPSATLSYNGSAWIPVNGQVVNGNVIIANSVPGTSIVSNSITGNRIAANTITGNLISSQTITANNIAANTITSGQIAATTITADKIATGTITATQIAASTITGNLIASNTIVATNIQSGTLTTNLFTANTINANILQANTFSANTISGNAIIANTFAANSISGNSIVSGSITTDKLAANVLTANTVVSTGATIGNFNSPGFWLQGNTGNARFGNTVSIGNNLTVGANAVIGGNLSITGLVTSSSLNSNTVQTTTMVPQAVSSSLFAENAGFSIPNCPPNANIEAYTELIIPFSDPNQIIYMNGTLFGTLAPPNIGSPPLVTVVSTTTVRQISGLFSQSYIQSQRLDPYSTTWTQGQYSFAWAGYNFSQSTGLVVGNTYGFKTTIRFNVTPPATNFANATFTYAFTFQILKR